MWVSLTCCTYSKGNKKTGDEGQKQYLVIIFFENMKSGQSNKYQTRTQKENINNLQTTLSISLLLSISSKKKKKLQAPMRTQKYCT